MGSGDSEAAGDDASGGVRTMDSVVDEVHTI